MKKPLSRGRGGGTKGNRGKDTIDRDDDLDSLEKQLLGKYGSNAFKDALLNEELESEKEFVQEKKPSKRFEGFNPTSKGNSHSKDKIVGSRDALKNNNMLNSDNLEMKVTSNLNRLRPSSIGEKSDSGVDSSLLRRLSARIKKLPTKKLEVDENDYVYDNNNDNNNNNNNNNDRKPTTNNYMSDDYEGNEKEDSTSSDELEEPRSGVLNAIGGFRLRKPPPISPEQILKEEEKNRKLLEKEEDQKLKRKAKREEEKSQFFPFNFDDDDGDDSIVSDKIFTTKTFEEVGITNPIVLKNLKDMGIFNPTKIQEKAIPNLKDSDVVMHAQTGSGKTLAYLLPLLEVIDPASKRVQALIFAPSRELVTQIGLVASALFAGTDINVVSIIGGANIKGQINRLRDDKPQIIISTPGRLAEIVFSYEKLRLGQVRAVIIDEIDNLLKEAFIDSLQVLLEATPIFRRQRNTVSAPSIRNAEVFDEDEGEFVDITSEVEDDAPALTEQSRRMVCFASATSIDPAVDAFADKYLGNSWKRVSVESSSMLPSTITHGIISAPRIKALEMLRKFLIAKPAVKSGLIFVNDPHRVEIVCEKLLEMGMIAAPLHGETSKDDRKEILTRLRDGRVTLVVTTELAARGLDIPDLTHVVNFELPTDAQHYVHRAGRCGRAGRKGLVMNFAMTDTKFVIRRFGKQLGTKILDCEIREGQVYLKRK